MTELIKAGDVRTVDAQFREASFFPSHQQAPKPDDDHLDLRVLVIL